MAMNKAKVMESALKSLNQGKVAQAIQEYQTILRSDPNDQVVLMTVGDLFVRQNSMPQAVEYFERLAQLYLNDGFNSKAIAIYKKISKLAPNETQPLEKLANLYVQQGILSEARPIFLQLAEAHLKANQTAKAVEVLRRLLEVEPDNPRVQRRLAELYIAMGQKKEAANTYLHFARYLHEHGDAAEAQKTIDAALAAEPGNSAALLLKARMLGIAGDTDGALKTLATLPDADSNSEILGLQIDICLKGGKNERAVEVVKHAALQGAEKYVLVLRVASTLIEADDQDAALQLIDGIRESAIASGNQEHLAKVLKAVSERLQERIEPVEWLVDLYRRMGNNNLSEMQSQLADAYANAGKSDRAEATLNELLEREPDNEVARQRLAQVRKNLGHPSAAPADLDDIFPQEPAPPTPLIGTATPVPPATPANDLGLDDETQRFVSQSLTDVDLFSSYGLTQKAIQLLDNILQRVPGHAPTLERLLDLNLGAGDDRRTAELAAQLEQIYTQRGDAINAERFTELRRRFQRASGATDEELTAAQTASRPTASPAASGPAEFSVPAAAAEHEIPAGSAATASPAEVAGSTRASGHEIDLSDEWANLTASENAEAVGDAPKPPAAGIEAQVPAAAAEATEPEAAEFELELVSETPNANNEATTTEGFLDQLVAEVEGLETSAVEAPAETKSKHVDEPVPEVESVMPGGKNELSEVFQEFRAELGEMGEKDEDEDLETHYNLGIAYREMGLLDEAIGEFQRVAKAIQEGRPFRYSMQCATLLGLVFMEKQEPKIAALWYQRALELPGLDPETVLALRYDLGLAEEQAGNSRAALDSFRQVYAMNIDYRDVAERIATLQKH
ncbi:MAG TPA: tetratricopeptide repeat protein [Candidatus Acidoferrales bacterium]|nr:tetratricopeptide repeat protein [Candidatus Acidoferrales bacterium]